MEGVKQFEIWWANLPDPVGKRPVLLMSRDDAYEYLSKFVAVEITSNVRGIASEISLGADERLPKACAWFRVRPSLVWLVSWRRNVGWRPSARWALDPGEAAEPIKIR